MYKPDVEMVLSHSVSIHTSLNKSELSESDLLWANFGDSVNVTVVASQPVCVCWIKMFQQVKCQAMHKACLLC